MTSLRHDISQGYIFSSSLIFFLTTIFYAPFFFLKITMYPRVNYWCSSSYVISHQNCYCCITVFIDWPRESWMLPSAEVEIKQNCLQVFVTNLHHINVLPKLLENYSKSRHRSESPSNLNKNKKWPKCFLCSPFFFLKRFAGHFFPDQMWP